MSASVLERTSIDEQLRWLAAVVEQLRQEVGDLRSENAERQRENTELRQQVSELRCDVGYWKSRHADAVKRDVTLHENLNFPNSSWRAFWVR